MHFKLIPLEPEKNILKRVQNKFVREVIQSPQRSQLRKELINILPDYNSLPASEFAIHSLLCHRDVEMGICCYKIFNYFAEENFQFIIHDDGSLTAQDILYIKKHIVAKVYTRAESDEICSSRLEKFPNILRYRQSHFLALKLIDVKMLSSDERIAYLDSDILFFRRPDFYLETFMAQKKSKNVFNKDIMNAYVDKPEIIAEKLGVLPYPYINAGLWVFNAEDISFQKLESWLSTAYLQPHFNSYRLEQTLVSLLAASSSSGTGYLPQEYDVNLSKLPETTVGKHYVGKIRHGFELEGIRYILKTFFNV